MRTLKYDGKNKFQCSCFLIMENEKEIGFVELVKDNGLSKNMTYAELISLSERHPSVVIITFLQTVKE